MEVCRLAATIGDDAGDALLDAHPEIIAKYAPGLTQSFRQLVIDRELAEVDRLLKLRLDNPVAYKDVASREALKGYNRLGDLFDHVDFGNRRQVVMVGCGWRPFTIFHIHDKTDVPDIVGLDNIPEAIKTANELAAHLGYSRLRLVHRNGCSYDYSDAQIVYVANMVSQKAAVVSRIADTAPRDLQLVVRDPYSLGRLMGESIEHSLDPRLEIVGRSDGSWNMTRDVYMRRRLADYS